MSSGRHLQSLVRSVPAKLAFIALLFVVAVIAVRALSLGSLESVDAASSEIRNRWLDSIQILGNLRHHVARVRTEEAELLLGGDPSKRAKEVAKYIDFAAKDIADYRAIAHDADETNAFETFVLDWQEHLKREQEIAASQRDGRTQEAIALFHGDALTSFHKAAKELRRLLDLTHIKAQAARKHARQTIETAQRFVSDMILATLALFVGLSVYLWRSFSSPLLEFAGGMRRLAGGDTCFEILNDKRKDEIGEMARSLTVLRRNTVELLESRRSLATQTEVLEGALARERELAAAQRNFLTTMSHEIRTPLTYIDGHAQRLASKRHHATPEEIADRADKIRSAVFQMTNLIASLTDEMEMLDRPAPKKGSMLDPSVMLRELVAYYEEVGPSVHFDVCLQNLPKQMAGDPKLLRCAFSNLISNAVKYSPEGSSVKVSAKAKDGALRVSIEDHGIGVPPRELERVRERFRRGTNVGSIPGAGIGLSLVEQIVEQHGGDLSLESETGKGTRVSVCLPLHGKAVSLGGTVEHALMH
jgi:two-component system OmpR family sensor kinase